MKLKNIKNNKEFIIMAFITIDKDTKNFKLLDIRDLKDYVLTDNGS